MRNLQSKILFCLFLYVATAISGFSQAPAEISRWKSTSRSVTIIRDNWGIPHVYGHTNSDAVFGLMYAQCEDDFLRIEMNYIEKLGRLSEVQGSTKIYDDLLIRLVIDSSAAKNDYRKSPVWLRQLLDAFADGINFYLYSHPNVHPLLLRRFEPWYPLLWTDGSIGAINTGGLTTADLKQCYGNEKPETPVTANAYPLPTVGSNGFALAPSRTASGNAILYINPHVTYYFRPEVHMVSDEGLNVYGAVTWGQFFIYQGFNEHCGWMHTSNEVDVADVYREKISVSNNGLYYQYAGRSKRVREKTIVINYKDQGGTGARAFRTWSTPHGPVMAHRGGEWLTMKAVNRSMNGLIQSWQRTAATSFSGFKKVMALRGNMSNNTVYADKEKNIAYWHGNFVPRRDTALDWGQPVDGTTPQTEWRGLHSAEETIQILNPASGWIQNCNSTPFTASGESSPKKKDYPKYMAPEGDNFRAVNAARLLAAARDFDLQKMTALGYNTHLAAFDVLLPKLFHALALQPVSDSLLEAADLLRTWSHSSSDTSVATTIAVSWGEALSPVMYANVDFRKPFDNVQFETTYADTAQDEVFVNALRTALSGLVELYGRWKLPWGSINRFQRLGAFPAEYYNDDSASIGVGRVGSQWGEIPSFENKRFPGTRKRYGFSGNSFICAVEFGDRVHAVSLLTAGESGNPASPHFRDQQNRFAEGNFKPVLFYKDDVARHIERQYHPGDAGN